MAYYMQAAVVALTWDYTIHSSNWACSDLHKDLGQRAVVDSLNLARTAAAVDYRTWCSGLVDIVD